MITNILENNFASELLYYLIEEPNKKYSFSTLKEITNFSNRSLYSAINTLTTYSILIRNGIKYELNYDDDLTLFLIEILKKDKKKFKFISTRDFLKIKKIINFLENKKLNKVFLFGSYARGSQRCGSDIDIAIFSSYNLDILEWQYYFNQKDIKVEFHLFNKKDVKNDLQKNIFEDGLILIDKN